MMMLTWVDCLRHIYIYIYTYYGKHYTYYDEHYTYYDEHYTYYGKNYTYYGKHYTYGSVPLSEPRFGPWHGYREVVT